MNEITRNEPLVRNEFVSANHKEQKIPGQTIISEIAKSSELASASGRRKSEIDSGGETVRKANKAAIKQRASMNKSQPSIESEQETRNHSANSKEIIEEASQPPVGIPICYSGNQIENLRSLGNHTFASQCDSDEFMQQIVGLLKNWILQKLAAYQPHGVKNLNA